MQLRKYNSDLLPLIKSLCGVEFAPIELPRINAMINSRARRAYRASDFWPRFFKSGEERPLVNGYIPWDQDGLNSIDTFIAIYKTAPFQTSSAQLFDFYVDFTGAKLIDGGLQESTAFVTYKMQNIFNYGDGTKGSNQTIPDEWLEYIAHGVYSDWLRAEGQMEKAVIADQEANDKLTDELIRIDEMRTLPAVSGRVITYSNMQSR